LRFHVAPTQNTQLLPKAVTRKTQRSFPALTPACRPFLLFVSSLLPRKTPRFAPDFPGFRGSNEANPGRQRGTNEAKPGRKCSSSYHFRGARPGICRRPSRKSTPRAAEGPTFNPAAGGRTNGPIATGGGTGAGARRCQFFTGVLSIFWAEGSGAHF
jgi:hypothetical protein